MQQNPITSTTSSYLHRPDLYINRELSWIEFNRRVLEEAQDSRHPLLERVKFLSIFETNLDEFIMIRLAGLKDQVAAHVTNVSPDGLNAEQQLRALRQCLAPLVQQVRLCWRDELMPLLEAQHIYILDYEQLDAKQRAAMRNYFEQEVFPVLTPLAVDPGHPFPHISNLSVNLAVELAGDGSETRFARVKIPDVIPRLLHLEKILGQRIDGKKSNYTFLWLDQLVAANLASLFPGVAVLASYGFRVIRD